MNFSSDIDMFQLNLKKELLVVSSGLAALPLPPPHQKRNRVPAKRKKDPASIAELGQSRANSKTHQKGFSKKETDTSGSNMACPQRGFNRFLHQESIRPTSGTQHVLILCHIYSTLKKMDGFWRDMFQNAPCTTRCCIIVPLRSSSREVRIRAPTFFCSLF